MTPRRTPDADAAELLLQQYSESLRAGLDPEEAVDLVSRSSSAVARFPALADALAQAVTQRASWRDALAKLGPRFPPETGGLLDHGQQIGRLPETLEIVAIEFEELARMRARLRGALTWPTLVACFAAVSILMVMVFVVPVFKEVFRNFGADLPGPTLLLIGLSVFVSDWWWVLVAAAGALAWAYRSRRRMPLRWDRWSAGVHRVPVLGRYLSTAFLVRVGRLMQAVAELKLEPAPVAAYLRASAATTVMAAPALALETALKEGHPLAEAVRRSLPGGGDLALALDVDGRGRATGRSLGRALMALDEELARLGVRLEQVMLVTAYVVVGLIVGLFVIAMYLPIFKLGAVV